MYDIKLQNLDFSNVLQYWMNNSVRIIWWLLREHLAKNILEEYR